MYGDLMIEKQSAREMKEHALKAIEELTTLLSVSSSRCSQASSDQIRMGVGLSIAKIQTELLDSIIYAEYPGLDDLK
jgi:hypothetical protein